MNAEIYRAANQYLKESERHEAASLILAGGWVEALNITMTVTDQTDIIRERIGEQKSALNSLINLLSDYDDELVHEISKHLQGIQVEFNKLDYTYTYKDPIHDKDNKTTHLKSSGSVSITDEQHAAIKAKVIALRNLIIS